VALASVRFRHVNLAVASVLLAGVAPILAHSASADYVSLFAYLMVIVLGSIWIVAVTGWRELILASLVVVVLYSVPHFMRTAPEQPVLLLFAYAFAGVFFLANLVGILREGPEGNDRGGDALIAAGTGAFLLAWILSAAAEEWRSLIISAWLVVFVAAANLVYRRTGRIAPFYAYAGVGVAMLGVATAEELSGPSLAIAYILEAGLVPVLVHAMTGKLRTAGTWALLFILPVLLSFQSMEQYAWKNAIFHEHFAVLALMSFTLLLVGFYFRSKFLQASDAGGRFDVLLIIGGTIYAYILLWLSLHAVLPEDTASMFSLVVYTLAGLSTYLYGQMNANATVKKYGGVVIGLVILRLLFVDIWNMELTGRIITFFVIGLMLLGTAFMGRNKNQTYPAS
jgi:hypothetical protein